MGRIATLPVSMLTLQSVISSDAEGGVERSYPLTEPELAMPSTRYSSPWRKSSRQGIM